MSPADLKDVAWLLMLVPIGIVLGTGIFLIISALRRARLRHQTEEILEGFEMAGANVANNWRLSLFEQPCRWLAIKSSSPAAVQAALDLHHAVPCSWEEGLVEAQEDKLFISPPVSGWILVVGSGLPEPSDDVDRCFHFLTGLSRKLGQVQFFSLNRVLNHHAWVLMEKGHVYRAYAWADETLWNQGAMTPAEKEIDMQCLEYGSEINIFAQRDALSSNSEKVAQLAARWSFDPSTVSDASAISTGIVGELSHSTLH